MKALCQLGDLGGRLLDRRLAVACAPARRGWTGEHLRSQLRSFVPSTWAGRRLTGARCVAFPQFWADPGRGGGVDAERVQRERRQRWAVARVERELRTDGADRLDRIGRDEFDSIVDRGGVGQWRTGNEIHTRSITRKVATLARSARRLHRCPREADRGHRRICKPNQRIDRQQQPRQWRTQELERRGGQRSLAIPTPERGDPHPCEQQQTERRRAQHRDHSSEQPQDRVHHAPAPQRVDAAQYGR